MSITPEERRLVESLDLAEMWRHLEYLCQIDRTSGSEGERTAVDYIAARLREYGCEVRVHEFDAYLSYPKSARLLAPGVGGGEMPAKTRAFSAATGPEGVRGRVVYVPGTSDMFTDTATVERLRQLDLRGKVVLSEGGGRQNMITARRLGAVAYIHLWPSDEDVIHEGIVTPIWGTPTPATIDTLPNIPVISVKRADGLALRRAAEAGAVEVTVITETDTRWHRLRLPEATIHGATPEYVLIAGHIDSWHLGATDNATGNVSCLELARVFQANRQALRRGVRVAWWPGHSTGRYAGSTWYCDDQWQSLHDHCVTYINIDSPGCLGAYDYGAVTGVAENAAFAREVVRDITGQTPEIERPVRAGDQSFWGPGVSSLFMLLSNRPEGQRAAVGGSGMGWWWHTEEDTIDKVEGPVLLKDTQIYALAAWRLCTAGMLPFDMAPLAEETATRIKQLAEAVGLAQSAGAGSGQEVRIAPGSRLDFAALSKAAERLCADACEFDRIARGLREDGPAGLRSGEDRLAAELIDVLNAAALDAIRALTPASYSPVAPHEHGPAVPTPVLPMLEPVLALAKLDAASDEAGFLRTEVRRRQNAVLRALNDAQRALAGAL